MSSLSSTDEKMVSRIPQGFFFIFFFNLFLFLKNYKKNKTKNSFPCPPSHPCDGFLFLLPKNTRNKKWKKNKGIPS